MYRAILESPWKLAPWREQALRALSHQIKPDQIVWSVRGESLDLFEAMGQSLPPLNEGFTPPSVPRSILHLVD